MRKFCTGFAALLLLVLAGCEGPPSGSPSNSQASSESGVKPGSEFTQVIAPLLDRHCVMCHMPGGAQGDLSLYPNPHEAMVGVASTQSELLLVKPGDAQNSYLYHKLLGSHLSVGGEGDSMPYQRALLETRDLEAIEQWINNGAGAE